MAQEEKKLELFENNNEMKKEKYTKSITIENTKNLTTTHESTIDNEELNGKSIKINTSYECNINQDTKIDFENENLHKYVEIKRNSEWENKNSIISETNENVNINCDVNVKRDDHNDNKKKEMLESNHEEKIFNDTKQKHFELQEKSFDFYDNNYTQEDRELCECTSIISENYFEVLNNNQINDNPH